MPEVTDQKILAFQRVRLRRLAMTIGSYCFTLSIVAFAAYQGFIAYIHIFSFFVIAGIVNGIFYLAIRSHWNLKHRDPNLTAEQMILSVLPALFVMYFMEDAQARTSFIMISLVPLLYGILGLDTRRFLLVGFLNFLMYLGLVSLLAMSRPDVVSFRSETIALAALLVVMVQIALVGGYISDLREKLRRKNDELNQALAQIYQMANQDELTGINNRRWLLEVIEQEQARCQRGADPFCLCILDIDHFKRINDTYGHLAGDEVLKRVAGEIKESIRKIDAFGRYGGEEFLLILPQTSIQGALCKAEKLRSIIEELRFPEIADHFRITLSIGVTAFRPNEAVRETIARADEALYVAKQQGRNRVFSKDLPIAMQSTTARDNGTR